MGTKIEKAKVEKAMEMLDNLAFMVNNWHEMQLALFMWERYGSLAGVTQEDLEKIDEILDNYDSLFDFNLIEEVHDVISPSSIIL